MDRLAYIIENNKDSLKVLKMSTSLLNVLPHNLKLEKFVADIFDELHKFQVFKSLTITETKLKTEPKNRLKCSVGQRFLGKAKLAKRAYSK